ncbi:hypothetical protein [Vibrio tapetis]|uniref:Uncharacterized protein n=1 Tax=Vibrio tapetis subsp. tapetis TaxID=1671868 RepID=A0A2N8ZHV7_9VIBR|nr:hypothetical protein [Vibrio tapetis]SON51493.1 protein of unknown function [Vibrio tapetis subsp. tapetis]
MRSYEEAAWKVLDAESKDRKNSVSSIKVNDYSKCILNELKKRTEISERRWLTRIVERGLKDLAKDMEQNKI